MLNERLKQQQEIQYVREQVLNKFPLLGPTMISVEIVPDDGIGTAATDGHRIIYSPKFMEKLSDEQKEFMLAHEVMHIAFNHILRSKGKDQRMWNIATDSVINQILKNENLPLIEGGIDIAEAINHSAEEMYEKLLQKKEARENETASSGQEETDKQDEQNRQDKQDGQKKSDKQDGQSPKKQETSEDNGQIGSEKGQKNGKVSSETSNTDWDDEGIDWNNTKEQVGHDAHDIWKEAVARAERETQRRKNGLVDKIKEVFDKKEENKDSKETEKREIPLPKNEDMNAYEKGFLDENQKERHHQAEQILKDLKRKKIEVAQSEYRQSLGAVGETQNAVVDWKKLLKKSLDEEKDRWSYRRADESNDYMARVEELEDEGRSETEVMLDVSGSVDERLLREFLRQLKPLLKSSKLKVGCFDEFVYPFEEIKTQEDIDNFEITSTSEWTENWDAAVRAFSKKKEVNKIVFTDGYPCPGTMPGEDLKGKNVIWIVYGNEDFNPCCGKVIQVKEQQLRSCMYKMMHSRGGR